MAQDKKQMDTEKYHGTGNIASAFGASTVWGLVAAIPSAIIGSFGGFKMHNAVKRAGNDIDNAIDTAGGFTKLKGFKTLAIAAVIPAVASVVGLVRGWNTPDYGDRKASSRYRNRWAS
ncbi:MAG: hypothetical protein J0M34_03535 [Alphaproteobacteria bacterium]|nr:hypothetical protein [Alphaproteobacteria bacterium]